MAVMAATIQPMYGIQEIELNALSAELTAVPAVEETLLIALTTPEATAPLRLEKNPPLASAGPATPAGAAPKPNRPPRLGKKLARLEPIKLSPVLIGPNPPPNTPPPPPVKPRRL